MRQTSKTTALPPPHTANQTDEPALTAEGHEFLLPIYSVLNRPKTQGKKVRKLFWRHVMGSLEGGGTVNRGHQDELVEEVK